MTKTLEEILSKLEKDFSELKEYAIKLEAENCMLRKELDKKDEDIPDNCAITLAQALNSAYVEEDKQQFKKYTEKILWESYDERGIPNNIYISSFYGKKLSNTIEKPYNFTRSGLRNVHFAILAVILIHYGINIKIDIESDGRYPFNELFEKYKSRIKFKPIKS